LGDSLVRQDAIAGRMVYPTYDLERNGIESREIPDNWMRVPPSIPAPDLPPWCFGAVRPAPTH